MPRLCTALYSLAISLSLMTGCRATMSDQTPTIQPPAPTHEVPLHFAGHNFEALCFNTIGCNVAYNGRYQVNDPPGEVSPPPPTDKRDVWGSVDIDIRNFPGPAVVSWKSLNGVAHEAKLDFSIIFKERLIWHNVPKAEMADFYRGPYAGNPNIYLEVDDRTINIYMQMAIPTKKEQIPGNKYSYDKNELFLVWTRTY